jgi:hypothetical protein
MSKKMFYSSLLTLFVLFVSLGFSEEPVLDKESLKLIKGNWSIWRGKSQATSSYEFTDTQALLIQGTPCFQMSQNSPEGKKPGIYTIFKVKGQTYLAFGWPVTPGKNAEKLDKAFLLSFDGANQFEMHVAPDDPDKIVCKRK